MHTPLTSFKRLVPRIALALVALFLVTEPLAAQYFGRNKVQYLTFDFQILETEHFDIYYYPEAEEAARDAARMAERWYTRLSQILNHQFDERQPLILYATHPDFQQTTVTPGALPEGTQAFAEPFQQRIVMPLTGSHEDTDHLIGHELVHAFQYDISGMGRAGGGIEAAARRFQVPLWFIEGMAEYLSIGPVDSQTAMWLRDAALTGDIPSVERMTRDPRVFPYRWGHAFWSYVGGRWGDAVIGQILRQVGQGVPYPEAFQRILNMSLDDISADWETAIRRTYLPLIAEKSETREVATPLIDRRGEGGRVNIGPAISPDGRWVAFISELTGLDFELFLADAQTGEVVRRLQRGSAFDPHFRSIRFIRSAGAWSPDSRQFVLSVHRGEGDVLVFLDVERAQRLREVRVPGVREISNPAWSPDGRTIAFGGIRGGLSNLYLMDVETEEVRQLTSDRYAALQPTFSPDGRTIAFVTDRGAGTDMGTLQFGGHRVALMDVETGAYEALPEIGGTKTFNPQWTRDGSGLYMISDRGGIPNIYRMDLGTGTLFRVTDIFTGVAGITDMSPALTAARDADRIVFSSYEDGGYNLYAITNPERLAGTTVPATELAGEAEAEFLRFALLPPSPRPAEPAFNRVRLALEDPMTGLPPAGEIAAAETRPYRPSLNLDYLGQPQVGVSVGGPYGGGGLVGGVTGIFSDMLGRHTVGATLQANGLIDEIGFNTTYIYTRERWNFGAAAQRIPFVMGGYQEGFQDGLFIQRLLRVRFFDSQLVGIAQYPFSEVMRAEFTAGARRFSQDARFFDRAFDPQTGAFVGEREGSENFGAWNFVEGSAALVYDNSLFGFTSPFAGQRFRFSVSPMWGDIQMVTGLADYRRYFFMSPFTLAVRGYHIGRYGAGAIDPETGERQNIFQDFFVGHPWYIRGYGYGSMLDDCRAGRETDCLLLQRDTRGNRLAVFNAEIRFPLIRRLELGFMPGGFPPIEGIAFADAGRAFGPVRMQPGQPGPTPVSPDEERGIQGDFLRSVGVGARVNVFGLLILEIDYVNALDRPRGWHWQFGFQPGF